MTEQANSVKKLFETLAGSTPSATGTWQNTPGALVGLNANIVQTGVSLNGSGTLWDPAKPNTKTPFTIPSGTNNYPAVTLAIDIPGLPGTYVGTFQNANLINGTVNIAGTNFPLNLQRVS